MEAIFFGLFEQKRLDCLLRNNDEQTLVDFSRFLAAYFANFPLICSQKFPLPSLFKIADQNVLNTGEYYEINRQNVSINLPIIYTPTLAAHLLFKCSRLLETVFYVDQFNDVRSGLIIRYLVDYKHRRVFTKQFK